LFTKIFAVMLFAILISLTCGVRPAVAQTTNNAEPAQIRTRVQSIGAGQNARVEVKLKNSTKVKGYVSGAGPDSFTVVDSKTGSSETVAYADVAQVKKSQSGPKARTWIILGGVAAAAVIVGLTVLKPVLCDGGAGC
jgi:sarcosine oxidase gamma subunit